MLIMDLWDFTELVVLMPDIAFIFLQITRIQNPVLYRQYVLCQGKITENRGQQSSTEYKLWHNASRDVVHGINMNGFRGNPSLHRFT